MQDLKGLVEELVKYPDETEYVEFKENFSDFDKEGEDICALSNSAALCGVRCAYKVWGVNDGTHEVVGTEFAPRRKKRNNQDLELWLRTMLSSNIHFEFYEGDVYEKHVVVLKIYPATYQIARFKGMAYIRTNSSTQKLEPGSKREVELWQCVGRAVFETQVALEGLTQDQALGMLDVEAYFSHLGGLVPGSVDAVAHTFEVDRLIGRDVDGTYHVTNLGAVLLARDLDDFPVVRRKAIRVIQYADTSRLNMLKDETFKAGYAVEFERVFQYLQALLPSEERIEGALRRRVDAFPMLAIRETLANAIVHQDFQAGGVGPVVEVLEGRVEVTNVGAPLVDVTRIVNDPPFSRNDYLAGIMRRMGVCEEAGTGWDKIVLSCEAQHLPAPRIETFGAATRVVLYSHRPFKELTPEERQDACYWHVCARYAAGGYATNQSLRERFDVAVSNSSQVSRLIKTCMEKGLIKPVDPETAPRYMRYIPAWA